MTARSGAALYTPDVLALAMTLADYPLTEWLLAFGEAQSRVCGSRIKVGLRMAPDGTVGDIGAQVTACAVGQASAAIFLAHARGRSGEEIAATGEAIDGWLAGGALPDWPGVDALEAARAYPARHGAIALPWKAARAALSNLPEDG